MTRAGLVGELGRRLAARQIDPRIAFLTSDTLTPTPFASAYRVEEVLPFQAKRVGEWLKARGVGRVTVVKRGSPVDADELMSKWKLRGDGHRAVILTRAVRTGRWRSSASGWKQNRAGRSARPATWFDFRRSTHLPSFFSSGRAFFSSGGAAAGLRAGAAR